MSVQNGVRADLVGDLHEEHHWIDQVTGSMVRFARLLARGELPVEEWLSSTRRYLDYYDSFMEQLHHRKEEDILFPAFVARGIEPDSAPLYYLRHEHHGTVTAIAYIYALLDTIQSDHSDERVESVRAKANDLASSLQSLALHIWEHADKEESVLLREADERIRDLDRTVMNRNYADWLKRHSLQLKAVDRGMMDDLLERYVPLFDLPEVIRGEGCFLCRHYGRGCRGIEVEWWDDYDWEDFSNRSAD